MHSNEAMIFTKIFLFSWNFSFSRSSSSSFAIALSLFLQFEERLPPVAYHIGITHSSHNCKTTPKKPNEFHFGHRSILSRQNLFRLVFELELTLALWLETDTANRNAKNEKKNQLHEFPPSNATIFSKSLTAFSMKTFTKFPFGEWFSLKFDDFRWMQWFWWDDSSWKYNLLFENKCGMMTCPTELKKNEECTEFLSNECAVRCEHGATIRLRFGLCQTNERETVLPQWRFSLRCVSNEIFAYGIPWLTDLMTVLWLVDVSGVRGDLLIFRGLNERGFFQRVSFRPRSVWRWLGIVIAPRLELKQGWADRGQIVFFV